VLQRWPETTERTEAGDGSGAAFVFALVTFVLVVTACDAVGCDDVRSAFVLLALATLTGAASRSYWRGPIR